jgi:isoleucyl-tRNA synthetase
MFILQPITPHLAEEVLQRTNRQTGGVTASNVTWDDEVRTASLNTPCADSFQAQTWRNESVRTEMQPLLAIRHQVMQLLEEARTAKYVKRLVEPLYELTILDGCLD